eukprot:2460224-Prymnesium_polylepis.1
MSLVAPSTRVTVRSYRCATACESESLVKRLLFSSSVNSAGASGGRLPAVASSADPSATTTGVRLASCPPRVHTLRPA